jgi:hypothetical protein
MRGSFLDSDQIHARGADHIGVVNGMTEEQ